MVDHTGCGRPVVDQLRQAGLDLLAVSLHGGVNTSHVGMNWSVPKRDLVGVVQVVLQQARLHIAERLPLTPVLTQELVNFKVKIDPATAHDSYSAWRERDHDDLVLALALALWWGERLAGGRAPQVDMRLALDYQSRAAHRAALDRAARQWGLRADPSFSAQDWEWEEQKQAVARGDIRQGDARRPERS